MSCGHNKYNNCQSNCGCGCHSDPCGSLSSNCGCCDSSSTVNSEVVNNNEYKTDFFIENTAPFNMPACDLTGLMSVEDSSRLFVGAVIWSDDVGFLTVTELTSATTVTVKNECSECNELIPGEPIPVSTKFGVGIPPCNLDLNIPSSGPVLDIDFLIPAVGACQPILATTTEGLYAGANVSILGQTYRISEISDLTHLTICNDGGAGPVGSLVLHDPDEDGTSDHPIVKTSELDLCLGGSTSVGKLVVCDSGNQAIMEGQIDNQVPAWNETTGQFELLVVDNLRDCTFISVCCLLLDPLDPGPYLVNVDDSAIFTEAMALYTNTGLKVSIGGDTFCVDSVVDDFSIRVTPAFTITEAKEYPAGTAVCIADCCDQCAPQLITLNLFDGAEPKEVLIAIPTTALTIPDGVSVITIPAGIGSAGTGGDPGDGVWALSFENAEFCACNKYLQVYSNFESVLDIPAGVAANIEYRMCKTAPTFDTQAFAAIPIVGGQAHLAVLEGTPNLQIADAIKSLNTFKGYLMDRDIVPPGVTVTFEGHFRLVFNNTTGVPQAGNFEAAVRAWFTASDADVAP